MAILEGRSDIPVDASITRRQAEWTPRPKALAFFPAKSVVQPSLLHDQASASHHANPDAPVYSTRWQSSTLPNQSATSPKTLHPSSVNALRMAGTMNFSVPSDLQQYIDNLDKFIDEKIVPLQKKNDNNRFFDHRREHARTDWDNGGLPRQEWEDLLHDSRRLADEAGFYRLSLPKQYGGRSSEDGRGSNLWMAVIREHLAAKGLGLFNDLQNEHSIVGNFPDVVMVMNYGNEQQKEELIGGRLRGKVRITFGLTEPQHGSDATHMETKGHPEKRNGVDGWLLNGFKKWQTGMHAATHCFIFARTQGKNGEVKGISCFVVPRDTPGLAADSYEWYVGPLLYM
jgi:alkylation response protein AidB-like acyl-CoA dehydrogenase